MRTYLQSLHETRKRLVGFFRAPVYIKIAGLLGVITIASVSTYFVLFNFVNVQDPHTAELQYAAFSPLGKQGGSIIPASCPSDPHYNECNPAAPGSMDVSCSPDGTQATLSWSSVADATAYHPRFSTSLGYCPAGWSLWSDGTTCYINNYSGTSVTFPVVTGQWYPDRWVYASIGVLWSSGTHGGGFSCPAPPLGGAPAVSAACTSGNTGLSINWSGVAGATYYRAIVAVPTGSPAPSGGWTFLDAAGVWTRYYLDTGGLSTNAGSLSPGNTYAAWAGACNASTCNWSSGQTLTCMSTPPNLVSQCSPDGQSANLSWDPVPGAVSYHKRIQNIDTGRCSLLGWSWTTDPGWPGPNAYGGFCYTQSAGTNINNVPVHPGYPLEKYTWWIHGVNALGYYGDPTAAVFSCLLPPPTNPVGSCNTAGTQATFSWTAPAGYNTFYTRVGTGNNSNWPTMPGTDDNFVGTSKTFPVTPGVTYNWWVHTKDSATGKYSDSIGGSITCAAAAANEPRGFLDNATCSTISGWTVDPDSPNTVNTVDIYSDGVLVGNYLANVNRGPGFPAATGIPGLLTINHGFSIPTPTSLKDGAPHSITAFATDLDSSGVPSGGPAKQLFNSPKTIQCLPSVPTSEPRGYLNANCSSIFGWTVDPDSPNTVNTVDIYSDGVLLGTYNAGINRPDVNSSTTGIVGLTTINHGFSIPTPASLKDGAPHSITAFATDLNSSGVPSGGPAKQLIGSPSITCLTTPPPTATLQVRKIGTATWSDTLSISAGEDIELNWTSTNATRCLGGGFSTGAGVPTSGTQSSVAEPAIGTAQTYSVSCDAGGAPAVDTVIVTTLSGTSTGAAAIAANPTIVNKGQTSVISGDTGGQACTVTAPGQSARPVAGAFSYTSDPLLGLTTFTLSCPVGGPWTARVRVRATTEEI